MAATNVIQFKADVAAFADKIGVDVPKVVQKISIDLWTGITTRTPVRTGRARANWFITQGAPSARLDEFPGAKPASIPAPQPPNVGAIDGTKPVYIINNLPYIESLENGHSRQAPSGMVAITVQAVEAQINAGLGTP